MWDRSGIARLAEENKPYEPMFADKLAPFLPLHLLIKQNPATRDNKDFFIIDKETGRIVYWLEFERDWTLPRGKRFRDMVGWWRGLNKTARKDERNFCGYIRWNPDNNTFWFANSEYIKLKASEPTYIPNRVDHLTDDNFFNIIPFPNISGNFEVVKDCTGIPPCFVYDDFSTLVSVITKTIKANQMLSISGSRL
jgi:hypothetical protein